MLAAVLAPMARRARSASNLARCTSNLGQVGKAILSYAHDHNDRLPNLVRSAPPEGWWAYKEAVKSYAGLTGSSSSADKVFACPEDRGYAEEGALKPFRTGARYNHTSYVF